MKWTDKLTAEEMKHVKETTNGNTLREFKRNREVQIDKELVCWTCKSIARKLGLS